MSDPTPAELTAAGFILPQGTDLIMGGDDAIRANAAAAYNLRPIKGALPLNTDLKSWRGVNWHRIPTTTHAQTIIGLPVEERGSILGIPLGNDTQSWARIFVSVSSNRAWLQTMNTNETVGTDYVWFPWTELTGTAVSGSAVPPSPALADALLARKGGDIGTSGRGVVAIRVDHNMQAMTGTLLPLLVERSLPASQCHFVEEMTPQPYYTGDDSSGSSWAQVQEQALLHGIEVWSHGWTHTDRSGGELDREITGSKIELERLMPQVPVTGFMVPGVAGSKWEGFGDRLSDPGVWNTTRAGQLIAATYASANGQGSLFNSLVGRPRFGWTSYNIDSVPGLSTVQSLVENAEETGTGVVFAIHPRVIDQPGSLSASLLVSILDYLVSKRDAGEIDILTVSGLLSSNPTHSHRHNMVRSPDFSNSSRWSGRTGWTIGQGRATAPGGTPALRQGINMSQIRQMAGGVREAVITVEADIPSTVELSVVSDSITATKTLDHPGDGKPLVVRLPFTIPLDAMTTSLQIGVGSGIATISMPRITPL